MHPTAFRNNHKTTKSHDNFNVLSRDDMGSSRYDGGITTLRGYQFSRLSMSIDTVGIYIVILPKSVICFGLMVINCFFHVSRQLMPLYIMCTACFECLMRLAHGRDLIGGEQPRGRGSYAA